MLTLKTSVASAILAGSVAATAGITYIVTIASVQVKVSCPPAIAAAPVKPDLPQGAPVPLNQGKTF